jgi:hypothetical protein
MIFSVFGVMYSGEYDACTNVRDVTLRVTSQALYVVCYVYMLRS